MAIWLTAMKFRSDIHCSQRMSPTGFGDPLTFSVMSQWNWHFLFEGNISTTTGWISMKFSTDKRGAQKMNPNDFVDSTKFCKDIHGSQRRYGGRIRRCILLTLVSFLLAPPWGWHFVVLSEMLIDTDIHVPIHCNYFGNSLTFHLVPPSGQNFCLSSALVCDQILAKQMTFPSTSALLCVYCWLANVDCEHGKR